MTGRLSTPAATALYVGAVLGPGLLFTPGLAVEIAGPASVVAWGALLVLSAPLAVTFAALGARYPEAGGTAAYARAAFGAAAARATGWLFVGGVVVGAPMVAWAGGGYLAAAVPGAGRGVVVAGAALIVAVVVAITAIGVTATARTQLALAGLLAALLALAIATALPHSAAAHWAPFAPHGWVAVGTAASVLMFSFIGWEAVAPLVGDLREPRRQLPRAVAGAYGGTALLYAGIAVATVGVLGAHPSAAPIADLMGAGLGEAGRRATVGLAVLLALGAMTTYVAGAVRLVGTLVPAARPVRCLVVFSGFTAVALAALALGALDGDVLARASSACFVAVYCLATAAGVRLLRGAARAASAASFVACLVLLGFSGGGLLFPAVLAAIAVGVGETGARGPQLRPGRVVRPLGARRRRGDARPGDVGERRVRVPRG